MSSFPRGKLLGSAWHLIRLAVAHCDRTGRDAVLESSRKLWLLCFQSHIIIPHMVVSFDSQQLMQATSHVQKLGTDLQIVLSGRFS